MFVVSCCRCHLRSHDCFTTRYVTLCYHINVLLTHCNIVLRWPSVTTAA